MRTIKFKLSKAERERIIEYLQEGGNPEISLTDDQFVKLANNDSILWKPPKAKSGGAIPLVPLIAGVSALLPALSGLYSSYNSKKSEDRKLEEQIRHNKTLEEIEKSKVKGTGFYLNKALADMKKSKIQGNGVKKTSQTTRRVTKGKGYYLNKKDL